MKNDTYEPLNSIKNISTSINSLDFLDSVGRIIYSTNINYLYSERFYNELIKSIAETESDMPLVLGAIVGYIYCGIYYTTENFYDLLPDVYLDCEGNVWGIETPSYKIPKCHNPKLRYVIRRIRNAFNNRTFKISIPETVSKEDILSNVKLTFFDENPGDKNDTFEMELCIGELADFVKLFTNEIHKNIKVNINE